MNKNEVLDNLKKLAAEIGKIELQRKNGEYVSMNLLISKKKEFRSLQKRYQD